LKTKKEEKISKRSDAKSAKQNSTSKAQIVVALPPSANIISDAFLFVLG
jgi:hypothetical protein